MTFYKTFSSTRKKVVAGAQQRKITALDERHIPGQWRILATCCQTLTLSVTCWEDVTTLESKRR